MNRALFRHRQMWLTCTVVAIVVATGIALGQAPEEARGHHDSATQPVAGQAVTPGPGRQQLMQNMTAADQRLSELVAKMNAATGDKKVDAMAAVITELVAQRKQMQEQMRMQGSMMDQMMSRMATMHGSGGMTKGTPEPKKDATDADHAAHHPEK